MKIRNVFLSNLWFKEENKRYCNYINDLEN